jgi:hypothetical protein
MKAIVKVDPKNTTLIRFNDYFKISSNGKFKCCFILLQTLIIKLYQRFMMFVVKAWAQLSGVAAYAVITE